MNDWRSEQIDDLNLERYEQAPWEQENPRLKAQRPKRDHLCWVIPLLIFCLYGVIFAGQSLKSFEIVGKATFIHTDLTPRINHILTENEIPIPNITDINIADFGRANVTNVHCTEFVVANANFTPTKPGYLEFDMSGVGFKCTAEWSYTALLIPFFGLGPHGSGTVSVTSEAGSGKVILEVDMEHEHPHAKVVDCQTNIILSNLELEGGLDASVLSLFEKKLAVVAGNEIEGQLCTKLKEFLGTLLQPPSDGTNKPADDVVLLMRKEEFSIWESIRKLWGINDYVLATLLLVFSGIWPHLKLFIVLVLWLLPFPRRMTARTMWWVDLIGKWSMVDILFVALFMMCLKVDVKYVVHGTLNVNPRFGCYVYSVGILGSLSITVWVKYLIRNRKGAGDTSMADGRRSSSGNDSSSSDSPFLQPHKLAGANIQEEPWRKPKEPEWSVRTTFYLTLLHFVTMILGLTLPCFAMSSAVNITLYGETFTDSEYNTYSIVTTAIHFAKENGNIWLLILLSFFVLLVPIVAWVYALFVASCIEGKSAWLVPSHLRPWDMRDVFMLTLIILALKIPGAVHDMSDGFAKISIETYTMPGYWLLGVSVIVDYFILFASIAKKRRLNRINCRQQQDTLQEHLDEDRIEATL